VINHYYDELEKIMEAGFRTEFDALDKLAMIAGKADDPGTSPTDDEKDPETEEYEHCRECGSKVRKDDRFCKKCGAKIVLESKSLPVTQKQRRAHSKKERGDENQHDTGAEAAMRESDYDMDKQSSVKKIPNQWLKQFFPQSAHGIVDGGIGSLAVAGGLYGAHKAHKIMGPLLDPPKNPGMVRTAAVKPRKRLINPVWNIRRAKKRHRISEALARTRG
jgi:hypothetical protein